MAKQAEQVGRGHTFAKATYEKPPPAAAAVSVAAALAAVSPAALAAASAVSPAALHSCLQPFRAMAVAAPPEVWSSRGATRVPKRGSAPCVLVAGPVTNRRPDAKAAALARHMGARRSREILVEPSLMKPKRNRRKQV